MLSRNIVLSRPTLLSARIVQLRTYSSGRIIRENDVLFLRQQGSRSAKWHLTQPLRPDGRIKLSYGANLKGSDLIGRKLLDSVTDSKGRKVILYQPTLASYIVNSRRMATPIYPHDASTIVSLLDLNLDRPGEDPESQITPDEPFEIFEAGTGMGSLTLHIARAIHAANPPIDPGLRSALLAAPLQRHVRTKGDSDADSGTDSTAGLTITGEEDSNSESVSLPLALDLEAEPQSLFDTYRSNRRAILHTLDRRYVHSRDALKLIRNFQRAMYLPTIDFYVGSINAYLSPRLAQNDNKPFLSRAILDLPSAHDYAALVIQALRVNGLLVIFKPSISQIAEFHAWCLETNQPVSMENVVELPNTAPTDGMHDGSGGRQWDVKITRPKHQNEEDGPPKTVQVMRPKVGDRLAGGGFVAVFRRWPVREASQDAEEDSELLDSEEDVTEPETSDEGQGHAR